MAAVDANPDGRDSGYEGGWNMKIGLRNRIHLLFSLAFVIMLALPTAGFALETSPGDTPPAPTIQSDLPDYAPGETVVLTGQNWQTGESVHIYVNDDEGQSWNRNVDVTADENGEIRDEFQLPDWFVATYKVTATGAQSGTAITTFTDGNVRVQPTPVGIFFDLGYSQYTGVGCTGSIDASKSGTQSLVSSTASTRFQQGVGNTEAIRLAAEPVSDDGRPFLNWSSPDTPTPSPFIQNGTFDPTSSPRIICIDGFSGNGTREYRANYATNTPTTNDAPVNLVPGPQTTNENTALTFSVANDNHVLTSDVDAGTNPVKVTLSVVPNGALTLSQTTGLTFLSGDGTNDATMTFTGTISNVNAALNGMSFTPNTNFSGIATLTVITDDQGNTGTGGAKTDTDPVIITVNNTINDAPVLDLNGGGAGTGHSASFTEDGGPVAAVNSAALTVSDDGANLASATVKINNLQDGSAESLDATVGGSGITRSYNSSTGVLTMNGSATVSQYQQVLRTVSYNNTSQNPNTASRSVTFVVNDGALDSNTATSAIAVNAINDAPAISNIENQTILEDEATSDLAFTVSDVDNAVGSLTLSGSSADTTLVPNANVTFTGSGGSRTVKVTPAANRFGGPRSRRR